MRRLLPVIAVVTVGLFTPQASISAPKPPADTVKMCFARCDAIFEMDIDSCWDENFAFPSNTAYAICLNWAHLEYRVCRNACD